MNKYNIGDITKFDSRNELFGPPYNTTSIVVNNHDFMIINVNNDGIEHCLSTMQGEEIILTYD